MTVYLRFATTDDVYTVEKSVKDQSVIVLVPHDHEGKPQLVRLDIMKRLMDCGAVVLWNNEDEPVWKNSITKEDKGG